MGSDLKLRSDYYYENLQIYSKWSIVHQIIEDKNIPSIRLPNGVVIDSLIIVDDENKPISYIIDPPLPLKRNIFNRFVKVDTDIGKIQDKFENFYLFNKYPTNDYPEKTQYWLNNPSSIQPVDNNGTPEKIELQYILTFSDLSNVNGNIHLHYRLDTLFWNPSYVGKLNYPKEGNIQINTQIKITNTSNFYIGSESIILYGNNDNSEYSTENSTPFLKFALVLSPNNVYFDHNIKIQSSFQETYYHILGSSSVQKMYRTQILEALTPGKIELYDLNNDTYLGMSNIESKLPELPIQILMNVNNISITSKINTIPVNTNDFNEMQTYYKDKKNKNVGLENIKKITNMIDDKSFLHRLIGGSQEQILIQCTNYDRREIKIIVSYELDPWDSVDDKDDKGHNQSPMVAYNRPTNSTSTNWEWEVNLKPMIKKPKTILFKVNIFIPLRK